MHVDSSLTKRKYYINNSHCTGVITVSNAWRVFELVGYCLHKINIHSL